MLNGFSNLYQLDEPISKLSVVGLFAFSLFFQILFWVSYVCLKLCFKFAINILLRTLLSKHKRSKTNATLCSVLSGLHHLHMYDKKDAGLIWVRFR